MTTNDKPTDKYYAFIGDDVLYYKIIGELSAKGGQQAAIDIENELSHAHMYGTKKSFRGRFDLSEIEINSIPGRLRLKKNMEQVVAALRRHSSKINRIDVEIKGAEEHYDYIRLALSPIVSCGIQLKYITEAEPFPPPMELGRVGQLKDMAMQRDGFERASQADYMSAIKHEEASGVGL